MDYIKFIMCRLFGPNGSGIPLPPSQVQPLPALYPPSPLHLPHHHPFHPARPDTSGGGGPHHPQALPPSLLTAIPPPLPPGSATAPSPPRSPPAYPPYLTPVPLHKLSPSAASEAASE